MKIVNKWSIIDEEILEIALSYTKGSYQKNLIYGVESLSGSTLRGKAKKYSGKYKKSAMNLISRLCSDNRISVSEEIGHYKRRMLKIVRRSYEKRL